VREADPIRSDQATIDYVIKMAGGAPDPGWNGASEWRGRVGQGEACARRGGDESSGPNHSSVAPHAWRRPAAPRIRSRNWA
jgi:hypothetical protein